MPYVASVGTYLPCWGTPLHRVAGDDEDAVTMAVEAGFPADTPGLPDLPVTRIDNSCAAGHDTTGNALFAVASGAFDVAPVMGADKLRGTTSADMPSEWEGMAWDYPLGSVAAAGFGLHVRRYLHESSATEEHLAVVAVKNHHRGVNKPKARLRFEITMEQALNAPMVVTPFRLDDCAPQSDGAVNPSGGLKAKAHPPGATGVAQCVEQLRGDAVNQVDGARIALAHTIGGPTAIAAVTILEGSGGLN